MAAPEPAPDQWLRRAQMLAAALAAAVTAVVSLSAMLWSSSVQKEQLRARVVIMEATDKGQDTRVDALEERLNRVVDHCLILRMDVSELRGRLGLRK
jgi:phage-related minor tail protein